MKADSSNSARKKYMTRLRDNYLKKFAYSPKQIAPFIIIALISVFMELSIFNIKHSLELDHYPLANKLQCTVRKQAHFWIT